MTPRTSPLPVVITLVLGAAVAPAVAEPAADGGPAGHRTQTAANGAVAEPAAPVRPPQTSAAPDATSRLRADAEIDPTAYILDGYSLHLGVGRGRLRGDLGAFAMRLPTAIHGQDGFAVSFDGFGAKLQYFLLRDQTGGFIGVDGGVARVLVRREGTDLAARDTQVSLGVNAGWRFDLVGGLYATAWFGVSRAVGVDDVMLDGAHYRGDRWVVFPAVHLGYKLR